MIHSKLIKLLAILFVMITLIIFLPLMLFKLKDYYLLNKVETQSYTTPKLVTLDKMDIVSRLSLICSYPVGENIVLTDQVQLSMDKEKYFEEVVRKELEKMQELGAFPKNDLEMQYTVMPIKTQTFMDMNNPNQYVKVNSVFVIFNQGYLSILIDSVTGQIYDIDIARFDFIEKEKEHMNYLKGFEQYLGLSLKEVNSMNGYEDIYMDGYKGLYQVENTNIGYRFMYSNEAIAFKLMPFAK